MGLFKSKQEKENERKRLVKESMRELEKRIKKLEAQEQVYVKAAQEAIKEELPDQVKLAKHALKLTVAERKRTKQMLLNAQIISQLKDMTEMTTSFLGAVKVISASIAKGTSADVSKISAELNMAMGRVKDQTEDLSDMLEESQQDIADVGEYADKLVDDKEIEAKIYGSVDGAQQEAGIDYDAEMEELRKSLK